MTNEQTELVINLLRENLKTLVNKADEELGNVKPVRENEWEYIGKDSLGITKWLVSCNKDKEGSEEWTKSKGNAVALSDLREFIDNLSEPFQE